MTSREAWQTIEYRIDRQGLLIYVSDSWTQFALDNSSPHLVSERVVGKPLLSFVSDLETRHLYQVILKRVRTSEVPVVVTLRCDSPSLRRFLQLIISRLPGEEIRFLSHTLRTEPRESIPLLDPEHESVKRTPHDVQLVQTDSAPEGPMGRGGRSGDAMELFCLDALPKLTHGVCPACYPRVMEEFGAK